MPQTTYPYDMPLGYPGQRADADRYSALTFLANCVPLAFGAGLALAAATGSGNVAGARHPKANVATLTFSADFVASNVINGSVVTTNAAGVSATTALAPTTYATSHAATIAAVAALIAAVAGVASATVVGDIITVTASPDYSVNLTGFVVTLGGSQATATVVRTTTDKFIGVAMHVQRELLNGVARFELTETLPVMHQGRIRVTAEQTVKMGDPVYVRYASGTGTQLGAFRKDADTSTALLVPNARWTTAASAGQVGTIELNLP